MSGGRLKITNVGLYPRDTRVELDGMDISHCLRSIVLYVRPQTDITMAKIAITVSDLEVDVGAMSMLTAWLAKPPEGKA